MLFTFVHPFVPSIAFISFIIHPYLRTHERLFLGSLPDYGMVPVMVTGPALFSLVRYSNFLVQPDLNTLNDPMGKVSPLN
jgi:hypothetical protein